MIHRLRLASLVLLLLSAWSRADHVIVTGGPALRKWENLRVQQDQHDRWWANFVRASTLRMAEIRKAYGPDAAIVWMVYQPGYQTRGREDGKPYTSWIAELAAKRASQPADWQLVPAAGPSAGAYAPAWRGVDAR